MTRPLLLSLLFTVAACSGTVETASQRIPLSSECQTWDTSLTPGALCTTDDPNFDGLRYPEQIAHCRRNVSRAEKNRIAAAYGRTTLERLATLKRKYDPQNLFRHTKNVLSS